MAGWQRPKFLAQSVQLTHIGHHCKWSGSFDWRLPHTAKARFEASILFFWFKIMFGARKADVPSCFKELLNTDKKLDCIRNARIHNARFLLWTLLVCNPGSAWFCALAMFAPVKFFELWIFHLNLYFDMKFTWDQPCVIWMWWGRRSISGRTVANNCWRGLADVVLQMSKKHIETLILARIVILFVEMLIMISTFQKRGYWP